MRSAPRPGERGTQVRFLASAKTNIPDGTFSNLDYSFKTLEHRLRELAFLNSGVRIIIEDERPAEPLQTELFYEGGVREFVKYIDRSKDFDHARTDLHDRRTQRHRASKWRCGGTTATMKWCCRSPTTSRSAMAAPIWRAFVAR